MIRETSGNAISKGDVHYFSDAFNKVFHVNHPQLSLLYLEIYGGHLSTRGPLGAEENISRLARGKDM